MINEVVNDVDENSTTCTTAAEDGKRSLMNRLRWKSGGSGGGAKFLAVATSEDDAAIVSNCSQTSVLSRCDVVDSNGVKMENLHIETNL